MKALFVIAAYNEEKSIGQVVQNLLNNKQHVLVVDDGSSDDTWGEIQKFGKNIFACRHPVNLGQGAALQTGIECARLIGPDYIVTFDADGQHDLEDALKMIQFLDENQSIQALLGSRFLGHAINIPFIKVCTLKLAIGFTRLFSGIKLTDVHNGLRVLRKSFYNSFSFRQSGMEHASEILDYIALKKVPFKEYPVSIRYTDYSMAKGQSWTNSWNLAVKLIGDKIW